MSERLLRPEEETDPGELAHSGQERELDVRVRELDGRVQAVQVVTVGAGDFRDVQCVQNRLVVLVHQHCHSFARALMQQFQKMTEPLRSCGVPVV